METRVPIFQTRKIPVTIARLGRRSVREILTDDGICIDFIFNKYNIFPSFCHVLAPPHQARRIKYKRIKGKKGKKKKTCRPVVEEKTKSIQQRRRLNSFLKSVTGL